MKQSKSRKFWEFFNLIIKDQASATEQHKIIEAKGMSNRSTETKNAFVEETHEARRADYANFS